MWNALWTIISGILSVIAGIYLTPVLLWLGLPSWLLFLAILYGVFLTLLSPTTIRDYAAAHELNKMKANDPRMAVDTKTSDGQLTVLSLFFVVIPFLLVAWFAFALADHGWVAQLGFEWKPFVFGYKPFGFAS